MAYSIASALVFLPGLRLDTLTLYGYDVFLTGKEVLDALTREGSGWRVLRYITRQCKHLGSTREHAENGKMVQVWTGPKEWRGVLEARDGKASGSSVVVYRAKDDHPYEHKDDQVFDPSTRTRFDNEVPIEGAKDKEVLIVVTRGKGVDYEVRADEPLLANDIRRDFPGETFSEIRKKYIDTDFY
ncbi:hypothetical protein IMZ48_39270 [Candidatus Bathyarchaeota archaeon]|nr:hypothetical protein [Candidatus Bathyarchaeota archaeon]